METSDRDVVYQDGVACPRKPPWAPKVSKLSGLPLIPMTGLAIYILASTNIAILAIWLGLLLVFAYPLRYLICARCPYYGRECSTSMGKAVPKMFAKQEGKSMKLGLWLDVVIFFLLLVIPLPQVWQMGGVWMLAAWLAVFVLVFAVLTKLACSSCPFTFCPIGMAGRAVWGKAG